MTTPTETILSKLPDAKSAGLGKWSARCPAHDDRRASLSIATGDDGRALVFCHAKCGTDAIVAALGLKLADLMPPKGNAYTPAPKPTPRVPTIYPSVEAAAAALQRRIGGTVERFTYHGADGREAMHVLRFDFPAVGGAKPEKTFRPIHPVPGGFVEGDPAGPLPLYGLPDLAARPDDPVYVVEGERKCDALRALGVLAVTSAHGSKSAAKTDWSPLAGRNVVVLPDADNAGAGYAQAVAAILMRLSTPAVVRIVNLPGLAEHGDVGDWILEQRADGRDDSAIRGYIEALAAECAPLQAAPEPAVAAPSEAPGPILPTYQTARAVLADHPHLRDPIIDGLLRQGETMNVIAPSKRGKSWLTVALALGIVTGRNWLGFRCERGDVLILDNELHGETIAHRLPKVADALGIDRDSWVDGLCIEKLRGRLCDIFSMREYFRAIEPGRFKVIVLDAFYRFIPKGTDENDNATMALIYNALDEYAAWTGCSFVLIHHSSKGNQSERAVTDVGAGAGAQSRAADTHLILRQHEQDDAVVLDAAVRSWPPVEPVCLRWAFPIWNVDPTLNATDLRKPCKKRRAAPEHPTAPPPEPWTAERFAATFATGEPQQQALVLARARDAGLSAQKAADMVRLALAGKLVHRWAFPKTNAVYLADRPQPVTETVSAPDTPPIYTQPPHTPRGTPKRPRGGGGAGGVGGLDTEPEPAP